MEIFLTISALLILALMCYCIMMIVVKYLDGE